MTFTMLTSRQFNQNLGRAKEVARKRPVFITDRGRPAHVLLSIGEYERLTGMPASPDMASAVQDLSDSIC